MDFRNVVITGASSGIGAALARYYAAPGVTLGLIGRDPSRLGDVADQVRGRAAAAEIGQLDILDRAALAAFLLQFDRDHPIDLLIANAGILDGRHADGSIEDAATARHVIDVNLLGTLDTLHAVLPAMRSRGRGSIALVSSLAALSPLPDAPAYSASKAGLLSYGLALRAAVAPERVGITVVCPGYVTSGMTAMHIGKHPLKIGAETAARLIGAGIAKNRAVVGFPLPLYLLALISPLVPEFVTRLATRGIRFHVNRPAAGRAN